MVDICLLGCGGGMPMPFRSLSSTILNFKGRKILIDCGEGTQVSMKIAGTGFKDIDLKDSDFPTYTFRCISKYGKITGAFDVVFDLKELEEFIKY